MCQKWYNIVAGKKSMSKYAIVGTQTCASNGISTLYTSSHTVKIKCRLEMSWCKPKCELHTRMAAANGSSAITISYSYTVHVQTVPECAHFASPIKIDACRWMHRQQKINIAETLHFLKPIGTNPAHCVLCIKIRSGIKSKTYLAMILENSCSSLFASSQKKWPSQQLISWFEKMETKWASKVGKPKPSLGNP